jgi:hypothetical protein
MGSLRLPFSVSLLLGWWFECISYAAIPANFRPPVFPGAVASGKKSFRKHFPLFQYDEGYSSPEL